MRVLAGASTEMSSQPCL